MRIKHLRFFNPKTVSKISKKLSAMFIPYPDPDFFPIPDPGVKKAPDTDPQYWGWYGKISTKERGLKVRSVADLEAFDSIYMEVLF
jgi:hypothetical protein